MSEDIKMSLWIDNNGHRTLDNFTKQEQAYYHASDVKTLREITYTLTNQVKVLRAALLSIKNHQQVLTPSGFEFSSVWQVANKALKESE